MAHIIALLSGLLFGLGLAISNMLNPQRVLAFLDIFGVWDPTLAFVMGGALLITIPGSYLVLKRQKPSCQAAFDLPSNARIDAQLLIGAGLFGLGWGLAGLCPGPAIAALTSLDPQIFGFTSVMLLSWLITDRMLQARNH